MKRLLKLAIAISVLLLLGRPAIAEPPSAIPTGLFEVT